MDRYTLKELSKILLARSQEYERVRQEMVKLSPDEECWKDPFSVHIALHCICQEIEGLKNDLDQH
jgi:hypothetical protein